MKWWTASRRLLAVTVSHARRRLLMSAVTVAVAAIAAGAILALSAAAVSRADRLLEELARPEALGITFQATGDNASGRLLPADSVAHIARLSGVRQAIAFSSVQSATTAHVADADVAVGYLEFTTLKGDDPLKLIQGRTPHTGEAIASDSAAGALRMEGTGVALVGGQPVPIVGVFTPQVNGPVADTINTALLSPAGEAEGFRTLLVVVDSPADVERVVSAGVRLLAPLGVDDFAVSYDKRSADNEAIISAANANGLRSTSLLIVLAATAMQMLTALLNVVTQRRENARRRALGYTRIAVYAVTSGEVTVLSLLGGAVGVTTVAALATVTEWSISMGTALDVVVLVTACGLLSAVPGALLAVVQDPARILRVP